jgi:hypothetical protein
MKIFELSAIVLVLNVLSLSFAIGQNPAAFDALDLPPRPAGESVASPPPPKK